MLFYKDSIDLTGQGAAGPRQYPTAIHDAANVFFDGVRAYSTTLGGISCDGSIMLQLSTPPPVVSGFEPIACEIEATTSGIDYLKP